MIIPISLDFIGMLANKEKNKLIVVLFGRPGSGKSTIAEASMKLEFSKTWKYIDLDNCITDLMKENFSKGIYPTVKEREAFINSCCKYTRTEYDKFANHENFNVLLVTFSFVNIDMRIIYRNFFPNSKWVLVDTDESEASQRIKLRKDHFYDNTVDKKKIEGEDCTNDWNFDPVDFEHKHLDGRSSVDSNAQEIANFIASSL